ncbi:ABC1-domain-containing protein [Gonapodya prolifera JEL478]|uniref:ABC1-domain-containing protein n=1 Tax=Gonapodya prolifera (strain JEL478) TaxID=1344416 RepID=A0A138ZZJ0_GONPJ|nr:ABC1-domain-containing protein [Gonapodya prolifera JEL478]|eukprot:KXS09927.1 ABC1-domain-containing protein [Gonapodya prolifera JEL478]
MPPLSRPLRRLAYFSLATGSLYAVDHFAFSDSIQRSFRTLKAGALITLDYKINFREGAGLEDLQRIHERTAQRILDTCKKNAGLYIKFGQAIASQNHVLPPQYNDTFKVLYDSAPVVPSTDVRTLFIEEFGHPPEAVFDEFDWTPIGSASIAQVHKARLKDGTPVAVKVQKPYIKTQMNWDLACQSIVTHALEYLFDIPMTWTLDYTHRHLRLETDFRNEARNAERAARDFKGEKEFRDDVYVPKVFWEHTSGRVMTAEWIDGVPLSATEEVTKRFDATAVVGKIVDMFGFQIFKSGFIHADPHPGNFLIRPNPSNPRKPQVVLLDHGLYVEESQSMRLTYAQFWKALMLMDLPTLTRITADWGMGDVSMAATSALMRPFDPTKAAQSGTSALSKPTAKDVFEAQMKAKERARKMLVDQNKFPKELLFVGRNMTIVRGVNKGFGSPADRVSMTARWAMRGTSSSESIAFATSILSTPPTTFSWLRLYISENISLFRFELHLFTLALSFWATKVYGWLAREIFGRKVLGYEEILSEGAKLAMGREFGVVLDERAFDA